MARGDRCRVCDARLGRAARFCASCGTPVGDEGLVVATSGDGPPTGRPVELDRGPARWPIATAVLAVVALVVALAATRSVDSPDADEAAATTTTQPTTTTTTTPTTTSPSTTSTTTSTTAGPTTTVAPGLVDVSAVPDDLTDTTLLLLGAGTDVSSLHLGTGELVTFESPVRFGTDEQVWSTSAGIVRQRFGPDETTSELLGWDL
ncbi:MAG: hypothetical protein AAGA17_15565, partial [Actinomycetota bacterium]